MLRIGALLCFLMLAGPAMGGTVSLEQKATSMAKFLEAKLRNAELLLKRSGDLVKQGANVSPVIAQATLEDYTQDVEGVRALLYVNAAGQLKLDSTRYPAPNINLATRHYFKLAMLQAPETMIVGRRIVGKQSGVPFIPLAMKVGKYTGEEKGVVVAVVTPESFTSGVKQCQYCFTAIFSEDGGLLYSNPGDMKFDPFFFASLNVKRDLRGVGETRLRSYASMTAWERVRGYPIIVTVTEVLPKGSVFSN